MANKTGQKSILGSITREEIGFRLEKFQQTVKAPIDCFYFQICSRYRKPMVNDDDAQQKVEKDITETADNFFARENLKQPQYGEWCKVEDIWPLTYFLEADKKRFTDRSCFPEYKKGEEKTWPEFEECLDKNIRVELQNELKKKGHLVPIVFMRVCKYTIDRMDTSDQMS